MQLGYLDLLGPIQLGAQFAAQQAAQEQAQRELALRTQQMLANMVEANQLAAYRKAMADLEKQRADILKSKEEREAEEFRKQEEAKNRFQDAMAKLVIGRDMAGLPTEMTPSDIMAVGLQTGYMPPTVVPQLAGAIESTERAKAIEAEKTKRAQMGWESKIKMARDVNDTRLAIAEMNKELGYDRNRTLERIADLRSKATLSAGDRVVARTLAAKEYDRLMRLERALNETMNNPFLSPEDSSKAIAEVKQHIDESWQNLRAMGLDPESIGATQPAAIPQGTAPPPVGTPPAARPSGTNEFIIRSIIPPSQ